MSWVSQGPKAIRLAGGFAVALSAVAIGVKKANLVDSEEKVEQPKPLITPPLNKVLASWTTNFAPVQEWDYNWDRRDPKSLVKPAKNLEDEIKDEYNEKLKKATPTASRHLILIRHGQYEMDPSDDKNRVLTALGRQQADLTGKRLKELPMTFDKLIHSTMSRAQETASIILKHLPNDLPVEVTDSLREGAPYPPEPKVGHWRPEKYFFQDGARIESAFRSYFHRASADQEKDSYEVLVCHANVIRYFACRALQLPPEAWLRMSLHNGSITWVVIRPSGRVALKCLGDAGFMPADHLTTT